MKRILAATAALLALSACGSQDPPTAADPTTSSPPPATSSKPAPTGPVAPTMPAAARQRTKAGAIAFAKYYWRVVDYAQATGDTRALRTLTDKACKACEGGADWIDKVHHLHGVIHGGGHLTRQIHAQRLTGGKVGASAFVVTMVLVSKPDRVSDAGKLSGPDRGGPRRIEMTVQLFGRTWKITSWQGV